MASVNLNNLTKKWGDFTAVDNFNLQILSSTSIFALLSPDCHFKLIKHLPLDYINSETNQKALCSFVS